MSPTCTDDQPPRRNARSFDLDDSATKAAAWVWHLHDSKPGVTTEGRFLSSNARRRSSSNSADRKTSRFREEAVTDSSRMKAPRRKCDTSMWDCGSSLYDTFELVAFGNWLDRRVMEAVVPITPSPPPPPPIEPLPSRKFNSPQVPCQIPRTRSLPMSMQAVHKPADKHQKHVTAGNALGADAECVGSVGAAASFSQVNAHVSSSKRWPNAEKLLKAVKRVGDLQSHVNINAGCKQTVGVMEPRKASQRPADQTLQYKNGHAKLHDGAPAARFNPSHGCYVKGSAKFISVLNGSKSAGTRVSFRDELLENSEKNGCMPADAYAVPTFGKLERNSKRTQSTQESYHRHLHHHHHYHHHHHLHHTLASQSVLPSHGMP